MFHWKFLKILLRNVEGSILFNREKRFTVNRRVLETGLVFSRNESHLVSTCSSSSWTPPSIPDDLPPLQMRRWTIKYSSTGVTTKRHDSDRSALGVWMARIDLRVKLVATECRSVPLSLLAVVGKCAISANELNLKLWPAGIALGTILWRFGFSSHSTMYLHQNADNWSPTHNHH